MTSAPTETAERVDSADQSGYEADHELPLHGGTSSDSCQGAKPPAAASSTVAHGVTGA